MKNILYLCLITVNKNYKTLKIYNMLLKKLFDKIRLRRKCKHNYVDVNCFHTGIFLYRECTICKKKKINF